MQQTTGNSASSFNRTVKRLFGSRTFRRLAILIGVLVGTSLLLGFVAGFILDGVISRRVVEGVNAVPGHHMQIGNVSVNVLTATVSLDGVELLVNQGAAAKGVDSLRLHGGHIELDGIARLKILFGGGLAVDEVRITGPRIEIYRGGGRDTLRPDTTGGIPGELETGLLRSLAEMLPERISPLDVDHIEIVDGALFRSRHYAERTVLDSIPAFTLRVDDLYSQPDGSTPDKPGYYSRIEAHARDIVLHVQQGVYAIRVDSLMLSSSDSLLDLRNVRIDPALSAEQFFDSAAGRLTRFSAVVPHGHLTGLRFQRMFYGELNAESFTMSDASMMVLSDDRQENNPDMARPRLPNEYLAAIAPTVRIDSVHLRHGAIVYSELHSDVPDTAVLNFTDINVDVAGVDTKTPSPERGAYISGTARLYNAAPLHLMMNLPLASDEPIYYEGWLEPMDATLLNRFLAPASRMQVTSGAIDRITFTVQIKGGRAQGTVTPQYHNLDVTLLEVPGAGESGIKGWLKRMAAKSFSVNASNPAAGDTVRVGTINYGRKMDEAFIGYIWSALREGMREVVGY